MYGAILNKGEDGYTCLHKLFAAIGNVQRHYNWLITDCVCYPEAPEIKELLSKDYCWISGDKLTDLVEKEDFQWIWAVISGFEKSISLNQVLEYPLPHVDGYAGFRVNPISIQHPLSSVEIVPWDSTLTLIISKQQKIVDDFKRAFPLSEDLSLYNVK